jgi:hypothetical protein
MSMRSKKEILKKLRIYEAPLDYGLFYEAEQCITENQGLILEVLLDIRDILVAREQGKCKGHE